MTTAMFWTIGVLGVATALLVRSIAIALSRGKTKEMSKANSVIVRAIRTRGREMGQLTIAVFGLVILAFIVVGPLAVDTYNSGPQGSAQTLAALIGILGRYIVKSEVLLWVARILFVVFVGSLLIGRYLARKSATDDQDQN